MAAEARDGVVGQSKTVVPSIAIFGGTAAGRVVRRINESRQESLSAGSTKHKGKSVGLKQFNGNLFFHLLLFIILHWSYDSMPITTN